MLDVELVEMEVVGEREVSLTSASSLAVSVSASWSFSCEAAEGAAA